MTESSQSWNGLQLYSSIMWPSRSCNLYTFSHIETRCLTGLKLFHDAFSVHVDSMKLTTNFSFFFFLIFTWLVQAYMVGVVFSKLTRPKMRAQTLMFSRNAVICQRDGQLCLMFRVGDMRKSHIIAAHIRAQMIRSRVTAEGEQMPYYQHELKVSSRHALSPLIYNVFNSVNLTKLFLALKKNY